MNIFLSLGISLFVTATSLAGDSKTLRTHYSVATRTGQEIYSVTIIERHAQDRLDKRYLVSSSRDERLFLQYEWDFKKQEVSLRVSEGSGKPVKVRYVLPLQSKTLRETLEEKRSRPQLKTVAVPVTVEMDGQILVSALDSDWNIRATSERYRERVKAGAGSRLIERLRELREVFSFPMFADLCPPMRFLTPEGCVRTSTMMIAQDVPDCEFDASFGEPCSDAQKAFLNTSKKKGRAITHY